MPAGYYALLGRGPSLVDIARSTGATAVQREERQRYKDELARTAAAQDLEARNLQEASRQRQANLGHAAAADAAKAQANRERYFAQMLRARPQDAGAIISAARKIGVEIPAEPMRVQLPDEQSFTAMPRGAELGAQEAAARATDIAIDLEGRASGALGAPGPGDRGRTTQRHTDYELAKEDPDYAAYLREREKQSLARAKAGAPQIQLGEGKQAVGTTMQRDLQAQILAGQDALDSFANIRRLASVTLPGGEEREDYGQFLTAASKAKQWLARGAEFLDIPAGAIPGMTQAQYEKVQDFRASVDKFRAEEFKRLLGSAQSEAEIENLVNTIISADMTPTQFRRALDNLERAAARSVSIAQQVLSEGIDVGDPRYRERFAEIERAKRGPGAGNEPTGRYGGGGVQSVKDRLNELGSEYMRRNPSATPEEARAAAVAAWRQEQGGQ